MQFDNYDAKMLRREKAMLEIDISWAVTNGDTTMAMLLKDELDILVTKLQEVNRNNLTVVQGKFP